MKRNLVTTTFMLVALAAAGCNATGATPSPAPATPPPATPPPATQAASPATAITTPAALRGTWTAEITGTTSSSGLWTMVISESNLSLQNPIGGEPFTLNPSSMSETAMVLPAESDCPDQSTVTPGTYALALAGDKLTITVKSDSCLDRSGVLSTQTWTKKP